MIPLFHDFSDSTVLVFGGGSVGARKARRFASEATVIVISPEFGDADFGESSLIRAAPRLDDIGDWIDNVDPVLVIAATDSMQINEAIGSAASDRPLLYNRVDESGSRDHDSVVVPSTIRDPPVTIAIATDGTAPALSKYLRQEIEETVVGAGLMAEVVGAIRLALQEHDMDPDRRKAIVTDVVNSSDVWTALRTGTANPQDVIEDVLDAHDVPVGDSV